MQISLFFVALFILFLLFFFGALPQTPFKKLLERSFLKIFKNFYKRGINFGYLLFWGSRCLMLSGLPETAVFSR
jgi:hypothetical protein